jgi:ADP-dependent phosphofructokinase/glucokinase
MTREEAIKVLEMFLHKQCDLGRTEFAYDANTVWDAVHMASNALKQEPVYFPPCVDCNTKMNEIREAYDKLKNQEPSEWQQDHAILKAHSDGANEVIDRVKQAREEIADRIDNYPDRNISEYEDCLAIIDKLIAEVEG